MGQQVEKGCIKGPQAQGEKYKSQLADRGIGQYFLDVELPQGNRSGKQGR